MSDIRKDSIGFSDFTLLQNKESFCYGVDAVLLASFSKEFIKDKKIEFAFDLGSGSGIIPLILAHKLRVKKIIGIEVQKSQYELFLENIRDNQLGNRIIAYNLNVKDIKEKNQSLLKQSLLEDTSVLEYRKKVDLVTCNPPYFEFHRGIDNLKEELLIARKEVLGTLEDFVEASSFLLKDKGSLIMVNRPARMMDIFIAMKRHMIEPKEVRLISPYKGEKPNIILIRGVKKGRKELKVTLEYVREKSGEYSEYVKRAYEKHS